MKSQKIYLITSRCIIFSMVLIATCRVEVWAQGQEKQWIVFKDQIPENSKRYNIKLRYEPSESTLCNVPQRNVVSVALPEDKQIDGYTEWLDFDKAPDGYRYSVLLSNARELNLINRDGRQICKARILRLQENDESEIIQEGYYLFNYRIEIPFKFPGRQLNLPTQELISGTFTINIYRHNQDSYRGSFSAQLKGSLTGSTFIEGNNLELSLTYQESLQHYGMHVKLALQPIDEEVAYESTSGKITDVLKLRSAKLVVEKIASDSSEIVLAVIHGDISQTSEEKPHLSINKPVPTFARVDLLSRKLLTLSALRKKAGRRGYIILIFGDLKRDLFDYRSRSQEINQLTLDETMISGILRKDLKTPPVVVFVCRRFLLSDLYEKWLNQAPGFHIIADYSNPMDVQFRFPSPYRPPYERPPEKIETLRSQLVLPEQKLCILLINGEGNLVYINIDAGSQLAETLTEINKIMRD